MPTKIVVGNWKMHGLQENMSELQAISISAARSSCDIVICPPATLIQVAAKLSRSFSIGGQDCHQEEFGAYTGDISAQMLADAGADYVILGHSERRENHLENSAIVKEKAIAAIEANLTPIICVGETLQQRESGEAVIKVNAQLQSSLPQNSNVVIAYEPIWAIGTGLIPTLSEISEIHDSIRGLLNKAFGPLGSKISILYGGSVKPDNARKIFGGANVNGALVGGASLKSNDFIPIIEALSDG